MQIKFEYTLTIINPLLTFRICAKYWLRHSLFWFAINGPYHLPDDSAPWERYQYAKHSVNDLNKRHSTDRYSIGWCVKRHRFEPQFRFSDGSNVFVYDLEKSIARHFRSSLLHTCREMGFLAPEESEVRALTMDDLLRAVQGVL